MLHGRKCVHVVQIASGPIINTTERGELACVGVGKVLCCFVKIWGRIQEKAMFLIELKMGAATGKAIVNGQRIGKAYIIDARSFIEEDVQNDKRRKMAQS